MKKQRKHYTPEERVAILRRHLVEGHARRASAGDSRRAGSEVGSGEGTAEESPPAGRVTDEMNYCSDKAPQTASNHIKRERSPTSPVQSGCQRLSTSFRGLFYLPTHPICIHSKSVYHDSRFFRLV